MYSILILKKKSTRICVTAKVVNCVIRPSCVQAVKIALAEMQCKVVYGRSLDRIWPLFGP